MPRAKNAIASRRRTKKFIKAAKGFFGRGKNVYVFARNRLEKGWGYAYVGRRLKKREYRALWIQRINAAARLHGMSYSELMGKLNEKQIQLDRKVLADMAMNDPEAFRHVVEKLK